MEAVREALAIALHDTRRSLKSAKGIVLLTLFVGSFLLAGAGFVLASESVAKRLRSELAAGGVPIDAVMIEKQAKLKLFEGFAGDDAELAASLSETPMIVLFFFVSALLFLPLLTALMGYDTIAGDVQGRTVRYTLLRARRGAYVGGKFLGQAILLAVFTLATNLVLLGFAALRVPDFDLAAGLVSLSRYWSLALVYGLVFTALAVLSSSLTRYPLLSLLLAVSALGVFGVLWMFGFGEWSLSFLSHGSPFTHWGFLFSPHPGKLLSGIGIYAGFTAVLMGAAYALVRGKDL